MTWNDVLNRINFSAIKKAFYWLFLNIFALSLPIGITYLMAYNGKGKVDFLSPISHGELTLYSVSLICSGFLILAKGIIVSEDDVPESEKPRKKISISFPGFAWFLLLCLFNFGGSIAFFCATFSQNNQLPNFGEIQQFSITASQIVLGISFVITFILSLIDAALDNPQFRVQEIFNDSNEKYQKKLKSHKWEG
jgi:hypothetical protein